jgi:hypothetical protein
VIGVLQGLRQQDESCDRLQHWESKDKYLSKGKTTACIEKGYLLDRKGILLVERGYFSIGKERERLSLARSKSWNILLS